MPPLVRQCIVGRRARTSRSRAAAVLGGGCLVLGAFLGGAIAERSFGAPRGGGDARSGVETKAVEPSPRVFVYGDSLVVQSEPYLDAVGRSLGMTVEPRAFGGIAPCDALDWLARDLRKSSPDVVVFAFSGNSLTDCMRLPDGALAEGDDVLVRYQQDIELAVTIATNAGAPFVLASPPASNADPDSWQGIDAMYREIAAAHAPYAYYVDAGLDIAPSGEFAPVQRCLPFEMRIAPTRDACDSSDNTISVRAGDGVHFCGDVTTASPGTCSSYSSGAVRYAIALVSAAKLDLDYLATLDDIAPQRQG